MMTHTEATNPATQATAKEVIMTAASSFSSLILSAPSWEVASDIYMEARAALCRDSDEWARCVDAMAAHSAPLDGACLYWFRA